MHVNQSWSLIQTSNSIDNRCVFLEVYLSVVKLPKNAAPDKLIQEYCRAKRVVQGIYPMFLTRIYSISRRIDLTSPVSLQSGSSSRS
jgi:hypothetical protein